MKWLLDYLFLLLVVIINQSSCTWSSICFGELFLDLPIRYLHIQLLKNGVNATRSVGPLEVTIQESCRLNSQLIDNFDGSYVLRLRLWSSCPQLIISVEYPHGNSLCDSPIIIKKESSHLYSEYCDCAKTTLSKWISLANCSPQKQLLDDLNQWDVINFDDVMQKARKTFGNPSRRYDIAFCHYRIHDDELYRHCYGEHTGFREFSDSILTSLMRKMKIPNTEFLFNLGDWPLQKKEVDGIPFISWCGSKDTMDIVAPTYELMKSVIDSMDSVALDIHTAHGDTHIQWEQKKNSAIFRGRDSNQLRLDVAELSFSHPSIIDAGITRYFFHDPSENLPAVSHIRFTDFFRHKFVITIDGTVAAYRLPFLLSGSSVILKSNSDYYEHFYWMLEPYVHYIPFINASHLLNVMGEIQTSNFTKMIRDMRQFVLDHLQPINANCYYANLIQKYTKKLKNFSTDFDKYMQHVRRVNRSEDCECEEVRSKATEVKNEFK